MLAVMNQFSFNKMKGKSLFLKNCSLLIEGIDVKMLEEIIRENDVFKIIEDEHQQKMIVMKEYKMSRDNMIENKDSSDEILLGLLVPTFIIVRTFVNNIYFWENFTL